MQNEFKEGDEVYCYAIDSCSRSHNVIKVDGDVCWLQYIEEPIHYSQLVTADSSQRYQNDILKQADDIIGGERQEQYGKAEDSFAKIAGYWSDYLSEHVTAHDVAMMMILLKVARTEGGSKKKLDNYIDIAGYAALAGGML